MVSFQELPGLQEKKMQKLPALQYLKDAKSAQDYLHRYHRQIAQKKSTSLEVFHQQVLYRKKVTRSRITREYSPSATFLPFILNKLMF